MAKSKRVKDAAAVQKSQRNSSKKSLDPKKDVTEEAVMSDPPPSPPQRKRRMASLNAEFFVRYTSTSYRDLADSPEKVSSKKDELSTSKNQDTNEIKGLNESTASISMKRKRSVSTTSVSKPVLKPNDSPKLSKKSTPVKKNTPKAAIKKPDTSLNLKDSTNKKKTKKFPEETGQNLNATCPEELTSGRPKREAGARASAMIIQTSEFEKSRRFSSTKKGGTIEPSERSEEHVEELPQAKEIAATADVETTKKVMVKALKKPVAVAKVGNKTKKNSDLPEVNNKTSAASSPSPKAACPTVTICDKLTEDVIKEHNSQNGSLGRGSGSSFTNLTKMYIVKWAMENVLSDERPFEEGQIPIEKFGVKILDQPQYLKNEKNKGKSFKQPETSTIAEESKKPEQTSTQPPASLKAPVESALAKPVNETNMKLTVAKSVASSLSGSVPLVVDETPMIRTDSATGMSVNSTGEKLRPEVTHMAKLEVEKETCDNRKSAEQPPPSVLRLLAENNNSSKKITENAENLIDIKNVADSPVKQADTKLAKVVLNVVTALANIEPPVVPATPALNEIKANVLSELMNESSNTNYSMED